MLLSGLGCLGKLLGILILEPLIEVGVGLKFLAATQCLQETSEVFFAATNRLIGLLLFFHGKWRYYQIRILLEEDFPQLIKVHIFAVDFPIERLCCDFVEDVVRCEEATVLDAALGDADVYALAVELGRIDGACGDELTRLSHVLRLDVLEIVVVISSSGGGALVVLGTIRTWYRIAGTTTCIIVVIVVLVGIVVSGVHSEANGCNALCPLGNLLFTIVSATLAIRRLILKV